MVPINVDVTGPGAIVALALLYMKVFILLREICQNGPCSIYVLILHPQICL